MKEDKAFLQEGPTKKPRQGVGLQTLRPAQSGNTVSYHVQKSKPVITGIHRERQLRRSGFAKSRVYLQLCHHAANGKAWDLVASYLTLWKNSGVSELPRIVEVASQLARECEARLELEGAEAILLLLNEWMPADDSVSYKLSCISKLKDAFHTPDFDPSKARNEGHAVLGTQLIDAVFEMGTKELSEGFAKELGREPELLRSVATAVDAVLSQLVDSEEVGRAKIEKGSSQSRFFTRYFLSKCRDMGTVEY